MGWERRDWFSAFTEWRDNLAKKLDELDGLDGMQLVLMKRRPDPKSENGGFGFEDLGTGCGGVAFNRICRDGLRAVCIFGLAGAGLGCIGCQTDGIFYPCNQIKREFFKKFI